MNMSRIEEIQKETAYPDSASIQQALLTVWREVIYEKNDCVDCLKSEIDRLRIIWWRDHKCPDKHLYVGDGRRVCNGCLADFKHDSVDKIEAAIKDSFRR